MYTCGWCKAWVSMTQTTSVIIQMLMSSWRACRGGMLKGIPALSCRPRWWSFGNCVLCNAELMNNQMFVTCLIQTQYNIKFAGCKVADPGLWSRENHRTCGLSHRIHSESKPGHVWVHSEHIETLFKQIQSFKGETYVSDSPQKQLQWQPQKEKITGQILSTKQKPQQSIVNLWCTSFVFTCPLSLHNYYSSQHSNMLVVNREMMRSTP